MGKESFEDKIRQQLESYEAPYEKSYWKKYARTYPAPRLAWWKLWWLPYIFSSLLFGGAWFWFGRDAQRLPDAASLRDTVVVKELVVTRDTLVVTDTVVLVWRTDDGRRMTDDGRRATEDGRQTMDGRRRRKSDAEQATAEGRHSVQPLAVSGQFNDSTQQPANSRALTDKSQVQKAESGAPTANRQEQHADAQTQQADSQPPMTDSQKPTPEEVAAQMDSVEQAAIADVPTKPESKMQDAGFFISAGPRFSSFSPLNYGNFDTRFGTFVGGAVQIDWQKWQLEMGLQYGFQLNELDELGLVPLERRQAFPGYSSLTSEPEEVGVISEHLLIPLQARFTMYDYRAWRVQVAGGVLGNAVLGETFVYDKENVDRDVWQRTVNGRGGLSISHLNAGIGTSYQWRQNLELQAILNYYHPLRPLGLNHLEAGALTLQLGLNWLLIPR